MSRPTIKDIAKESGFSLSTVSLVLNNHPRISPATRDKVMEVVRRYNYYPSVAARGLASRSSRTISVVVPNLTKVFADIYFGELVSGIHERATAQGFKILLDIATEKFIAEEEYLKLLASRRADGMLFIASDIHATWPWNFVGTPHNFLLVNHWFPGKALNYVSVDYGLSARLAAQHLLGLGHRKIGMIAGTNTNTGLKFREEFLAACQAWPAGPGEVCWVDGGEEWSERGGYAATAVLMSKMPDLTAVMAANDRLALGAMRWLAEHHREVPEDVSVMGVDDIQMAGYANPGLTTIRHDLYQVGVEACNRLFQLMRGEITECRDLLPTSLVVRGSTGRVRGAR